LAEDNSNGSEIPVKEIVTEPVQSDASEPIVETIVETLPNASAEVSVPVQPVPKLSEKELKEKVNHLRQQLDQKERELKVIFREISLHSDGGQDLKTKRDGLNARVKELSPRAAELRKKRDEVNAKISELKAQRDGLKSAGKGYSEKIDELKKIRDGYNQTARGRTETLEKAYGDELNVFLTGDIPLEHEINVFKRLMELGQRIDATKKANMIHSEISIEYNRAKDIYTDLDGLHAQIQTLAKESQKYHLEMIASYNEIDTLRKEADSYHVQLTEKFKGINPLRKKISALKNEIPRIRDELGIYLEQMKDVQLVKDGQKTDVKREQAKEKYEKTKRLSLEEFKILVESDDIKL
jgi:uncharacterized coiled-coil DUF342 family protein